MGQIRVSMADAGHLYLGEISSTIMFQYPDASATNLSMVSPNVSGSWS